MGTENDGLFRLLVILFVMYVVYRLIIAGANVLIGAIAVVVAVGWVLTPVRLGVAAAVRGFESIERRRSRAYEPSWQHKLFADFFRREERFDEIQTAEDGRPLVRVTAEFRRDRLWRLPVEIEVGDKDEFGTVSLIPRAPPVPGGERAWIIPYDRRIRDLRRELLNAAELPYGGAGVRREIVKMQEFYRSSRRPPAEPPSSTA